LQHFLLGSTQFWLLLQTGYVPSAGPARPGSERLKPEKLEVEGVRPLAMAADLLERKYGWQITYEDPPYLFPGDVARGADPASRPASRGALLPRPGRISIDCLIAPSSGQPADPAALLEALIRDHAARRNAGRFRLLRSGPVYQMVPDRVAGLDGRLRRTVPLLDTMITLAPKDRSVLETVREICSALDSPPDIRVSPGMIPEEPATRRRVFLGVAREKARDVLLRIPGTTKETLVWRLYYDPAGKQYLMNLHTVRKGSPAIIP
jgi:hypothetical protein